MKPPKSSGILLEQGRFAVSYHDKTQDCLCRVTFDLTRKSHVLIDCLESLHKLVVGTASPFFQSDVPFQVTLPGAMKPVECHIAGPFAQSICGDDLSVYLILSPEGGSGLMDRGLQLSRVNGAIVNLNRYHLGREQTICLEDETWKVELTPVEESRLLFPPNIQNKSYLISHHLLLQKRDGAAFSCTRAEEALWSISIFLSFCAERWVSPELVAGFDEAGTVVMQDWRPVLLDPYRLSVNWLDEFNGQTMTEIFPGFSSLMQNPEWKRAIRTGVYWYVRADTNRVGPDGAIVLVQAALERLAWHILVTVKRSISESSFPSCRQRTSFDWFWTHAPFPWNCPFVLVI